MSDQPMGFHVPPGGSGHGPPFAPQNPTGSINIYRYNALCTSNFIYACVLSHNNVLLQHHSPHLRVNKDSKTRQVNKCHTHLIKIKVHIHSQDMHQELLTDSNLTRSQDRDSTLTPTSPGIIRMSMPWFYSGLMNQFASLFLFCIILAFGSFEKRMGFYTPFTHTLRATYNILKNRMTLLLMQKHENVLHMKRFFLCFLLCTYAFFLFSFSFM